MSDTIQNINDSFFDGVYKEIWRESVAPGLTEAEVDFIEEVGNLKSNSKVLDIMCGFGRHSIGLAKREYSITAVDNSEGYITELTERADQQGLSIKTIQANALEFSTEASFDAAILMGNSFTYFDKKTCLRFLKNINDSIRPGARLIINEWLLAEIVIKVFREKNWIEVKDYICLTDSRYLFDPSRIETEYTIVKDDRVIEKKTAIDYIFSIGEVHEMLERTGFKILDMYSTPRKRKFTVGDLHIYIVAEKL